MTMTAPQAIHESRILSLLPHKFLTLFALESRANSVIDLTVVYQLTTLRVSMEAIRKINDELTIAGRLPQNSCNRLPKRDLSQC